MKQITRSALLAALVLAMALVAVVGRGLAENEATHEALPDSWIWNEYPAQSGVYAMAREGNTLWVGTVEGVVSFNVNTHAYHIYTDEGAPEGNLMNDIYVDPAGVKWFATNEGGLFRYDDQSWTNYSYGAGLNSSYVRAVTPDPAGFLFLAAGDRLYRFNGVTATQIATFPTNVTDLAVDLAGRIWATTGNGTHMFDGSEWVWFDVYHTGPGGNVYAATVDGSGNIWFAIHNIGVGRWSNGNWTLWTEADGLPSTIVNDISANSSDVVWVATDAGAARFVNGTWSTFSEEDGVHDTLVHSILSDGSGVSWAGTDYGVTRLDSTGATDYLYGSRSILLNGVAEVDASEHGGVWARTDQPGLYHFDGTRWEYYTEYDGLPQRTASLITADLHGGVWVTTIGESTPTNTPRGLAHFDGQTWHSYDTNDGLNTLNIVDIEVATNGDVWFGGYNGLSRFDGTTWTSYGQSGGLASPFLDTIAVDGNNIWIGYGYQDGLTRFDGANWETFTTADGMASDNVFAVDVDSQGKIWVGTMDGISMYDGNGWVNFGVGDGLVDESYLKIVVDPLDRVWAVAQSPKLSVYDGSWTTYDWYGGDAPGTLPSFNPTGSAFWSGGNPMRQVFLLDQYPLRTFLPAIK